MPSTYHHEFVFLKTRILNEVFPWVPLIVILYFLYLVLSTKTMQEGIIARFSF